MASPRRAALAALLLAALAALLLAAPAAAQTLPSNWNMEGGSAARYNSIRYVTGERPDARNRASVFELYLGDSDMVGHDLYAHATPVTTTNRLVIISDVNCNVLALPLPEDLPQLLTPDRAVWAPLWIYTDAASDPAQPNRECTSAVADGSRVYWLSRQKRQVFGIETALGAPERLQWSPATLPLEYFSPDAFADHGTGLILRNYSLWIPSKKTAAPGFMSFDVRSGAQLWVQSNQSATLNSSIVAPSLKSFAGSVGAIVPAAQLARLDPDGTSIVAFVNGVEKDPLEFIRRGETGAAWQSPVGFHKSNRTEHPNTVIVTNLLSRAPQVCLLIIDADALGNGIIVDAVDITQGTKCKQWPNAGVNVLNQFVADIEWISSGSYLRETQDNPQPIIFFTSRLGNGRASLTSWIVTNAGFVLRDGHMYNGQPACAPLMLRHAYGNEYHAIIFPGPGGQLQAFDAWALSEGVQYSVNLRRWNDRDNLRIIGPYMAGTQGGSALVMARATGTQGGAYGLYLYGVSHAQFSLPGVPSASPSSSSTPTATATPTTSLSRTPTVSTTATAAPQAAGAAASVTDTPGSPASVAAGLFGGLFAVIAAAVAVAVFLPASAMARAVRGGAGMAARALASGGSGGGGGGGYAVGGSTGIGSVGATAPASAERLSLLSKAAVPAPKV